MMRKEKDTSNLTPSKGWAKLGHKLVMFILWPLRRPIFFVLLLIALYLVPTFIGSKPTEVHLWYLNKFKQARSDVSNIISETAKDINLPKIEMPSISSMTGEEKTAKPTLKVVAMPAKEASRRIFEKAKSEPVRVDIMQKKDDITNPPAPVVVATKTQPATPAAIANAAPKKKLALVYVDGNKTISGVPGITNANELVIDKETVFLYGVYVDPNTSKGQEAKVFLNKTIDNKAVSCTIQAYTYQGIATGICTVNGVNLNKALVENGFSKNVALE